jgi:hypothetical protein
MIHQASDRGVNASLFEQERKAFAQLGMAGTIVEVEQFDPHARPP